MNVYQNPGKKTWMLCFSGPKPGGSWGRIRESSGTTDREKAERILKDRVRATLNAREGLRTFEPASFRRLTVGELLDSLVAEWKRKELRGLSQNLYRVRALRDGLGYVKVRAVNVDSIRSFSEKRRTDGLANASINREVEILRTAFRLAGREGRILTVPCFPAPLPEAGPRQGFLEAPAVAALMASLPAPLDAMVQMAFRCGWRRGELLSCRWEWIGKDEIRLPGFATKSGKGRTLPLTSELRAILSRLRKADMSSPFVFSRAGRAINKTVFGKQFRRAAIAAGLGNRNELGSYSGVLFHDLRRSAIRNLTQAGVSQTVAMKISGHETASVFTRYDIVTLDDTRRALESSQRYTSKQKSNVLGFAAEQ